MEVPQSADVTASFEKASRLHEQGNLDAAEALYRTVLARVPKHVDALHRLAILHYQRKQYVLALARLDEVIMLSPSVAGPHYNRGLILHTLGRYEEALVGWNCVLKFQPDSAEAYFNRANTLRALRRFDEAVRSYDIALQHKPAFVEALNNRGNTLRDLKRPDEALASYDNALRCAPGLVETLNNRGTTLMDLRRFEEALACYDHVLQLKPDFAQAHANRAILLQKLERYDEALQSYESAIRFNGNNPETYFNRGMLVGGVQRRYAQAIADFERALHIDPEFNYARGQLLHMRMHCCDWSNLAKETKAVEGGVSKGRRVCRPFVLQAICSSPQTLRTCAEIYTADFYPASRAPMRFDRAKHSKIRLGYVSGEFGEQATSFLTAGLFELHDRRKFEVYAFDNGHEDGSTMRSRLKNAFDAYIDIVRQSDIAAAKLIHERDIDILINLNGYFGLERTGVFALRPSPIQVNYLGFPGTMGAPFMDYIIADRILIPEAQQKHYAEKVVYLPDCYQVNDSKRRISEHTPTRTDAGLPEKGFIFCSFNNSYKYTPFMFDVWMRLMHSVEGSVLWILESNGSVKNNLRREAETRGVEPDRLIFARQEKLEDHLARLRLADLFLDSLPSNAHTTASDALWVGLPLITCMGSTFASRVAGSLLHALGLPELITDDLESYETLARRLATTPSMLMGIRSKLARNRHTHPLFDTDRFRRHIEAAYTAMYRRYVEGRSPETFDISPMAA